MCRALRDARAGARPRRPGEHLAPRVNAAVVQSERLHPIALPPCPSPLSTPSGGCSLLDERPVPPQAQVEEIVQRLGTALPDGSQDPAKVIEHLATACEPGLTAMPSGRFFGMVIGGTHPAAMAADWLVTAWDQNAGLREAHPARPPHRGGLVAASTCSGCPRGVRSGS